MRDRVGGGVEIGMGEDGGGAEILPRYLTSLWPMFCDSIYNDCMWCSRGDKSFWPFAGAGWNSLAGRICGQTRQQLWTVPLYGYYVRLRVREREGTCFENGSQMLVGFWLFSVINSLLSGRTFVLQNWRLFHWTVKHNTSSDDIHQTAWY